MSDPGEIKAKREAAARARRLSTAITLQADRDRMLAFAAELDAQADALEREMTNMPPPVTQMQMQVQQGPPSAPTKPAESAKEDGSDDRQT
jgi:hypothetical protein